MSIFESIKLHKLHEIIRFHKLKFNPPLIQLHFKASYKATGLLIGPVHITTFARAINDELKKFMYLSVHLQRHTRTCILMPQIDRLRLEEEQSRNISVLHDDFATKLKR